MTEEEIQRVFDAMPETMELSALAALFLTLMHSYSTNHEQRLRLIIILSAALE